MEVRSNSNLTLAEMTMAKRMHNMKPIIDKNLNRVLVFEYIYQTITLK